MAKKKPWYKKISIKSLGLSKIQPGKIIGGVVSSVSPAGAAAVATINRVSAAVKKGARTIAAEAKARGVPALQVAEEKVNRGLDAADATQKAKSYAPWIIGGVALVALVFLARRK